MEQVEKKGFFRGLRDGLRKTRDGFVRKLIASSWVRCGLDAQTLESSRRCCSPRSGRGDDQRLIQESKGEFVGASKTRRT